MSDNYDKLIERISRSGDISIEELENKIEAKRTKLSGLISKEGAAQIVAAELGVSFDSEKMKISELSQGVKRVNIIGKITKMFPVREFKNNDREGKIGSFLLGDETSNTRVVLWDDNHISLLEEEKLKEGDVVEISSGGFRNGEVHLSSFADIKKSKEKIENVVEQRALSFGKIKDAQQGNGMKVRAVIVQTFEPRYFESKQKEGEKGVLLNVVLDDGSETIRAVLFGENINKLGLSNEEIFDLEKFKAKKESIIGDEKIFSGNFRMNTYFNNLEMSINGVEDFDVGSLVQELEAKT